MDEDLGECLILKTFLKKDPPCSRSCTHKSFPSYHDVSGGRGCWVAHTALCILEATRVKDDIIAVLNKRGIEWKTLILALLLHDSGKLSKDYTSMNKPRIHHNEVSAQIAYDVLTALQKSGYIADYEKNVVSRSCFLHMEYYLWRNMVKGGFTTINQITIPGKIIELADDAQKPLENLELILKEIGEFDRLICLTISEISKISQIKLRPSTYTISSGTSHETLLKILSLQWFMLLFDNRASSARRNVNFYWSEILKEVTRSSLEANSCVDGVIRFSDRLLSRLRGKLTPLPRTWSLTL